MIAVDTNILIAAHRGELPRHERARAWLAALAARDETWGVPVFSLAEFVRVVTHPRVFDPPTPLKTALAWLAGLAGNRNLGVLMPGSAFPAIFAEEALAAEARGNLAFDAQIAALCRERGVSMLLTEDRDFQRFARLRTGTLDEALPSNATQ